MNKKYLIVLVALLIASIAGYCIWQATAKGKSSETSPPATPATEGVTPQQEKVEAATDTPGTPVTNAPTMNQRQLLEKPATGELITYNNKELHISFQHPASWVKIDEETRVTDRNGILKVVEINFIDASTKTSLVVAYHLPPAGADLYKYAYDQIKLKKAAEISVGKGRGVEALSRLNTDGKGRVLPESLSRSVVDVLNEKTGAEVQFQFQTVVGEKYRNEYFEVIKFKKLLDSFSFSE